MNLKEICERLKFIGAEEENDSEIPMNSEVSSPNVVKNFKKKLNNKGAPKKGL